MGKIPALPHSKVEPKRIERTGTKDTPMGWADPSRMSAAPDAWQIDNRMKFVCCKTDQLSATLIRPCRPEEAHRATFFWTRMRRFQGSIQGKNSPPQGACHSHSPQAAAIVAWSLQDASMYVLQPERLPADGVITDESADPLRTLLFQFLGNSWPERCHSRQIIGPHSAK